MTENEPTTFLEHVEAVAGLTIFTISSGSLIAGSIWTIHRALAHPDTHTQLSIFVPVAIIMGVAMIASCIFLLRALVNARSPILVYIAAAQPRFLPPLIMATWWMWHFISMSVAAEMFWDEYRLRYGSAAHGLSSLVIRLFVIASASVAANIFLLLAVGAFNRGEPLLRGIYRMRFVLDVLVAVAVTAVPPRAIAFARSCAIADSCALRDAIRSASFPIRSRSFAV